MGDGALSPDISAIAIDFDLINELFFDGFWLQATDASGFRQPLINSTSDINLISQQQEFFSKAFTKSMDESSSRLWIGPSDSEEHDKSVKRKLVQAINFLRESIRDKDVLVQIWIPVRKQGKQVLTTSDQPFSLNSSCKDLANYRDVSSTYQFDAEENCTEFVGLPGRVFLKKLPEWTPDVRFFRREEYPRVKHAQLCNVRGSLALPVLEHGSGICLGVVEIVSTHQKLDFHPELQNVCKALEVYFLLIIVFKRLEL